MAERDLKVEISVCQGNHVVVVLDDREVFHGDPREAARLALSILKAAKFAVDETIKETGGMQMPHTMGNA